MISSLTEKDFSEQIKRAGRYDPPFLFQALWMKLEVEL